MISEDTKDLIAGLWDTARSALLLALPWTRRAEMNREIGLVADVNGITRMQAFALMYSHATPSERLRLEPYRPPAGPDGEQAW